ncbi:hypothetical protein CDAR_260401 [Caerostris darwini]|uniref:Uncharacterized protein n=1 Tax=Caerostris darwini TaxID=1538125 RepID=A0AAV4NPD8_9ARAC|nr:hypothetical protein CDAR_260401 [Caerostris darwini]
MPSFTDFSIEIAEEFKKGINPFKQTGLLHHDSKHQHVVVFSCKYDGRNLFCVASITKQLSSLSECRSRFDSRYCKSNLKLQRLTSRIIFLLFLFLWIPALTEGSYKHLTNISVHFIKDLKKFKDINIVSF